MAEKDQLLNTLKRQLRAQGMTYRDLAATMKLSEPTVKRMFSTQRWTLERIIEVSNLLGFTLAELAQEAALGERHVHTLTEAQERELVSDAKLLLVAVCVLNQWSAADIGRTYTLTEAEIVSRLTKLDRLRLLALLPGNRIRLNVARDFDWLPRGPIRAFFRNQGMGDFLAGEFGAADETLAFTHGMLTESAVTRIQEEVRRLRQRFADLHEESVHAPLGKRKGTGMLLALRGWEPAAFAAMRRVKQ